MTVKGISFEKRHSVEKLSLQDLEVRYENIRKSDPKHKKCSMRDCSNPRDSTEYSGQDTCCAYHRLLFDFWACDVARVNLFILSQKGRRRTFTNWQNRMGKDALDKLVLQMMAEPVNWKC